MTSDESFLPAWTKRFIEKDDSSFMNVRYLLSFRPFSQMSETLKSKYLSGSLSLIPFPGSLVFWGCQAISV